MATVCSDSSITLRKARDSCWRTVQCWLLPRRERDEARILREKLRLYSTQGRNCVGSRDTDCTGRGAATAASSCASQLDLDRQALRAQVVRIAKQLEVILQPSDRFTGLLMEGER
ncbi:hypothetical protein TcBrA4_0070040 [Trypanosoma cruzi]|nr:hypothetical protein TcBrA4_0070040 [Trypanosoma cruzi]